MHSLDRTRARAAGPLAHHHPLTLSIFGVRVVVQSFHPLLEGKGETRRAAARDLQPFCRVTLGWNRPEGSSLGTKMLFLTRIESPKSPFWVFFTFRSRRRRFAV